MKFLQIALTLVLSTCAVAQQPNPTAVAPGVLSAVAIQRLMPPAVFFHGQLATVQLRNSSGISFGSGGMVLAGIVDTGGYSSAIQSNYEFYLLSDTAFEINGKKFSPGSYGCGFPGKNVLIMDLGGNELYRAPIGHDDSMTRPRPLQTLPGKTPDEFRLYLSRDYVTIRR